MKATGMFRKIDELGRIVLPAEIRQAMDIKLKDSLEIYTEGDAIILKNMDREITLRSKISHRGVCVSYPDMAYLGIWHWPKTDAPYVCIEPWTSLPGREEAMEDLSHKSDLIHLEPGKTYENTMTVTIGEN